MNPGSKNIVICCDGTGNQFGDSNSNVVKLYTTLCVNKEQVAYYHPGVGTMGAPNRITWLGKKASQISGLAFGAGFTDNMADAYRYLMEEYRDGDRIFLFGFSRGAYTVRALAGALNVYGLLCRGNVGHLPYLLRLYSTASRKAYSEKRTQMPKGFLADAFKATFSRVVPIHFVGVWDTVSSIGFIYDPVKLLFDGQNPIVAKGRHAVSIDERRCFFQDNLWGESLPLSKTPVLKEGPQDIVQAWFPGVHSDVGGSYRQSECAPSEKAFEWLVAEAKEAGLLLNQEKVDAVLGKCSPNLATLCDLYSRPNPDASKIHESLTWKWWPLEFFPHKYFDRNGKKRWQIAPTSHRRELPDGAILHPYVQERLKTDSGYRPKNLDAGRIVPLGESPVKLPCPGVEEKLAAKGFSVYRPETKVKTRMNRAIPATAAILAACALGWTLLRR